MNGRSSRGRLLACLSIALAALILTSLLEVRPADAHGSNVEGTYGYDMLNRIVFQDGRFSEQYVTDQFHPDMSGVRPNGRKQPGVAEETLCTASGFYTVVSSGVLLAYEADLCNLKQGTREISYDSQMNTVTIDGKVYKYKLKGASRSESRSLGAFAPGANRSMALDAREAEIEAGHKTWRWEVAKALEDLNNNSGGIWYCPGGDDPHLNPAFWSFDFAGGGWIPSFNVPPSDAMEWFYRDMFPDEGCTECLMATRSAFYEGLHNTLGRTVFNRWFQNHRQDLIISPQSTVPTRIYINKAIFSEEETVRGDHVYFRNMTDTDSCPEIGLWQGENAITQNSEGTRTFIGLGIPGRGGAPLPGSSILASLFGIFQRTNCDQTRAGQMADFLIMANPLYFGRIPTPVRTLRNGATLSSLSGVQGSIKHFKVVVPAGSSGFAVNTAGGTGNADLFVMRGQWATRNLNMGKSLTPTNRNRVAVDGAGVWYVALFGETSYSGLSIAVRTR